MDAIIGKSIPEAMEILQSMGYSLRVEKENGQPLPVTMDCNFRRVNVAIVNDQIKSIIRLG